MVVDTAVAGDVEPKTDAWEEKEQERTNTGNCRDSLSKIVTNKQVAK